MNDNNAASPTSVDGNKGLVNGEMVQEASAHLTSQDEKESVAPKKILVVEDDHTLATLEADALTASGYSVLTVESGELAILTFRRFIPDLIVLDLELAGTISGWDVLQALRNTTKTPVLITSSSVTAIRKYMRSCGETRLTLDHLPKPYPLQTLLKRVKRMLPITLL